MNFFILMTVVSGTCMHIDCTDIPAFSLSGRHGVCREINFFNPICCRCLKYLTGPRDFLSVRQLMCLVITGAAVGECVLAGIGKPSLDGCSVKGPVADGPNETQQ
jgi:hypothetical protein